MQADLALGIDPKWVRAFHATGKSGDKIAYDDGQYWLDQLAGDKDMQALLAAGDPVMRMRFRLWPACSCPAVWRRDSRRGSCISQLVGLQSKTGALI